MNKKFRIICLIWGLFGLSQNALALGRGVQQVANKVKEVVGPKSFCLPPPFKGILYWETNSKGTILPHTGQLFTEHCEEDWKVLMDKFTSSICPSSSYQNISVKLPKAHFEKISYFLKLGYHVNYIHKNLYYVELLYKNIGEGINQVPTKLALPKE